MWAVHAVTAKQLCDWVWHSPFNNEPLVNISQRAAVTFLTNLQTGLCLDTKGDFLDRICSRDAFLFAFLLFHREWACVEEVCVPALLIMIAAFCQPCSGSSCAVRVPAKCTLLLVLAVTCGSMWGFCRSTQQQQQKEGDLLCSQLFSPVLTVLCGWDCLTPPHTPPSSPPSPTCSVTHWLPLPSSTAAGKTHALQADNTTVLLSLMSDSTVSCHVMSFVCAKHYRCTCAHLANWYV